MNKQDKELLLKDLCARLPYGVRMNVIRSNVTEVAININPFNEEIWLNDAGAYVDIDEIKPYLRPMSNMTKEEDKEWQLYKSKIAESCDELLEKRIAELHDWFCKKHLDFHGLIPIGLALEAPKGMYDF